MFFNYAPTVYLLTATKVFHLGVAGSLSRRTGPHLNESYDWHLASNSWVPRTVNQDGFPAIVPECGDAAAGIGAIAKTNPITAERLLALSAGQIESPSWHAPKNLDSCNVEASEIIRRITFCQDDAPEAADFRTRRLRRCAHLARLIERDGTLPASLADLRPGAVFNWSPDFPHQNIASSVGRRATVIYLGEEVTEAGVDRVSRRVADFVGRAFARPNEVLEAHQRLHVWYRDGAGNTVAYDFSDYLRYDKPRTESPLDFTRSA